MKTLIVITGPTAVGKTELCLDLAGHFDIPIINADSRQLYQDLKIGTAAPTADQLRRVRHYFVGTLQLADYYSASMYEQQVMELLDQLFQKSDYALLAGGSMMYIDAVCNGIDDIPTVDDHTRQTLKQRLADEGLEALCEELRRLDPEHYEIVDRKNPRRVVHALEICLMTGRTYTSYRKKEQTHPHPLPTGRGVVSSEGRQASHRTIYAPPLEGGDGGESGESVFQIIKIGLNLPREELYERINRRVDKMMDDGLLDEARKLYPLNALNTVGYKEMFTYIDGTWTLEEAVERMKGNTRRYARKQLTWFKKDPIMKWFSPEDKKQIINYIEQYG